MILIEQRIKLSIIAHIAWLQAKRFKYFLSDKLICRDINYYSTISFKPCMRKLILPIIEVIFSVNAFCMSAFF